MMNTPMLMSLAGLQHTHMTGAEPNGALGHMFVFACGCGPVEKGEKGEKVTAV